MPTEYDNQTSYTKFQSDCNCGAESSSDCTCGCSTDECSCCPIGTVAVYNEDGTHKGCLSPNDAEIFEVGTHVPTTGYVKVIDSNGKYYGDMSPSQAIEYLNFIENGIVNGSTAASFNVVSPEVGVSGFYELSYQLADGITDTIGLQIDRVGITDAVTVSIQNSAQNIEFDPSGTVSVIPLNLSSSDVKFKWTGIAAPGVYTFDLRFFAAGVEQIVPTRLTLT
ncbi:MAG: hypothetical protein ACTSRU_00660 [Candidatus Hodarchaeales archaeon]